MKTKEELNALKNEVETLDAKLAELTEEELKLVVGGLYNMPDKEEDERYVTADFTIPQNDTMYEHHFYYIKKNGLE